MYKLLNYLQGVYTLHRNMSCLSCLLTRVTTFFMQLGFSMKLTHLSPIQY